MPATPYVAEGQAVSVVAEVALTVVVVGTIVLTVATDTAVVIVVMVEVPVEKGPTVDWRRVSSDCFRAEHRKMLLTYTVVVVVVGLAVAPM